MELDSDIFSEERYLDKESKQSFPIKPGTVLVILNPFTMNNEEAQPLVCSHIPVEKEALVKTYQSKMVTSQAGKSIGRVYKVVTPSDIAGIKNKKKVAAETK